MKHFQCSEPAAANPLSQTRRSLIHSYLDH
jgi:hypothetical protein